MLDANSERARGSCADSSDDLGRPARPKPLFGVGSFVRYRRMIGLSGLTFLMLGLVYATFRPSTYTASTQLLIYIRELQPGPETVILPGRADLSVVQNQIEIIQSRGVLLKVIDSLNLRDDPEFDPRTRRWNLFSGGASSVSENQVMTSRTLDSLRRKLAVRRVGTSHTLTISVTADEPTKAARVANEIGQVYLQERVTTWEFGLSKAPSSLRERLQGLGPSAYVISVAEPPINRDGPRLVIIALAAAVFGIGAGAATALVLDWKNHRIRTPEQIEYLFGLECFGAVPNVLRGGLIDSEPKQRDDRTRLLAWGVKRPESALAQTLRRVRAAVRGSSVRSVGVTSVVSGEGTTTISANLAYLMATSGKRVLLVDATQGNGSLSRLLTSGMQEGLITSPNRTDSVGSRVVTDTRTGLDILLPSNATAADPDFVWRTLTDDFMRQVANSYDLVIVDLPALDPGAEAREAAKRLDAFLLVVKWDNTDFELARRALSFSGEAQQKFLGVVMNMAEERRTSTWMDKFPLAGLVFGNRNSQTNLSGPTATAGFGAVKPRASS